MSTDVAKYYRYFVDSADGSRFLTEWTDVSNLFEYVDTINTLGGDLTIKLARSIRNKTIELAYMIDEDGGFILDEDGGKIITEYQATTNVGPGTDVDHGNRIRVYEYYGTLDYIIDENGDYITGEDGSRLLAESGALDGRCVFRGYISKYEVNEEAANSGIIVTALPMATVYSDLIFESFTWQYTQNVATPVFGTDMSSQNGTDVYTIAQTFQAPATGPYLQTLIGTTFPSDAYLFGYIPITAKLYTGNNPNGARTLLHTYTFYADGAAYAGQSIGWTLSITEGPDLSSGSWYHLEVSTTTARIVSGNAPFKLLYNTTGYTPGSYWTITGASTTFVEDTGKDMYFQVQVLTSRETRATYTGWSLYEFVDQTVDLVTQRTRLVNPNNPGDGTAYIEDPGVTVPEIILNGDTYKDRMDTAVKASPPGWYYRYNHTDNRMMFKPRHETADHTFIAGVHIKKLNVVHDAEQIKNTVYFTGAKLDINDPDSENLYLRRADADSVARYGTRAEAISDYRYSDPSSAELRVEYELLTKKDAVYRTTVIILDTKYDTGIVFAGQTVGFTAFGDFRDDLVLQIIRKETYKGLVVLTLGALAPTERKRLDDLKAAVDGMMFANNDSSPA